MRAVRFAQPVDERLLLRARKIQRRCLDCGLQVARDAVRFPERQVLSGRAFVRALDQLFDPLHLLPQRPLGGRASLFGALPDRCLGAGEALLDRFVDLLDVRPERGPLADDRVPVRLVERLLRRELLGRGRQLAEAGGHAARSPRGG